MLVQEAAVFGQGLSANGAVGGSAQQLQQRQASQVKLEHNSEEEDDSVEEGGKRPFKKGKTEGKEDCDNHDKN